MTCSSEQVFFYELMAQKYQRGVSAVHPGLCSTQAIMTIGSIVFEYHNSVKFDKGCILRYFLLISEFL